MRNRQGLTEEEFLAQYDPSKYERPSVTVDMAIFTIENDKLKLLMVKRADHPSIGKWALPGGFVNMDENLIDAAKRELFEETSLENIHMEQLQAWGDVDRDPRTRIITVAYMALVDSSLLKAKAGDDAAEAEWFEIKSMFNGKEEIEKDKFELKYKLFLSNDILNLSADVSIVKTKNGKNILTERNIVNSGEIASDHAKIIQHALEVLQNKVLTSSITSNLLQEEFAIEEFYKVYKIICGEKLSMEDFLDKVSFMLSPALKKGYYRFNDGWKENLF